VPGGFLYYYFYIRKRSDSAKDGNVKGQPGAKSVELPKVAPLPNQTESETSSEDGLGKRGMLTMLITSQASARQALHK
jgi:hypothetical protein